MIPTAKLLAVFLTAFAVRTFLPLGFLMMADPRGENMNLLLAMGIIPLGNGIVWLVVRILGIDRYADYPQADIPND